MPTHKDQAGNDIPALVTFTTAAFIIPAIGSEVAVWLDSKEGLVVGQQVLIPAYARFRVSAIDAQVRLVTLSLEGDAVPGATVPIGTTVSSAATPPPLSPAPGPTPVLISEVTLSSGAFTLSNASFTTASKVTLTNVDDPASGAYGTLTYTRASGSIVIKSSQGIAANKVIVVVWSW